MQLLTAGKTQIVALAFAPDGRALVATVRSSVPHLWTLPATGDPVLLDTGRAHHSFALTFSADANVVGWVTDNRRWEHDRRIGATRAPNLTGENEWISSQAGCGADGRIVLRTSQHQVGAWVRGFVPDGAGGWASAWNVGPTEVGGWSIAGCPGDRFFLWESPPFRERDAGNALVARSALTGQELARVNSPARFAGGMVAAPDGSAVAFFRDSSLYLWRPGAPVQKARTGTLRHYRALAFHPDGRHLLAGNNDPTARLIDTHSWQVVKQYTWDVGELSAVAVSPDGALGAAGGARGRVVVWDLDV